MSRLTLDLLWLRVWSGRSQLTFLCICIYIVIVTFSISVSRGCFFEKYLIILSAFLVDRKERISLDRKTRFFTVHVRITSLTLWWHHKHPPLWLAGPLETGLGVRGPVKRNSSCQESREEFVAVYRQILGFLQDFLDLWVFKPATDQIKK